MSGFNQEGIKPSITDYTTLSLSKSMENYFKEYSRGCFGTLNTKSIKEYNRL
jgi:hypothetical protein